MTERTAALRTIDDDAAQPPAPVEIQAPRSGRIVVLHFEEGGEHLRIAAPGGATELSVRLTPEGPVLELHGAAIELVASREVAVRCERFVVDAREDVVIAAGGDKREAIAGDHLTEVGGQSRSEARGVAVTARLGSVEVKANDDVALVGERIFLNR